MASEILAVGSTAASSTDVAVLAGEVASVFLKDAAGPDVDSAAVAYIQIKDSANEYFNVGVLTRANNAKLLYGPATYRVTRPGGVSFGVEQG